MTKYQSLENYTAALLFLSSPLVTVSLSAAWIPASYRVFGLYCVHFWQYLTVYVVECCLDVCVRPCLSPLLTVSIFVCLFVNSCHLSYRVVEGLDNRQVSRLQSGEPTGDVRGRCRNVRNGRNHTRTRRWGRHNRQRLNTHTRTPPTCQSKFSTT